MTEHFIKRVEKKLAPGFSMVKVQAGAGMGVYEVHNGKGALRDEESGAPIRFGDGAINRQGIESTLRRLGAIPPPQARNPKPRAEAVPKDKTRTNPILMAGEILRDTKATPRERRMAQAYLQLAETHKKVRALAGKLGTALREKQEE